MQYVSTVAVRQYDYPVTICPYIYIYIYIYMDKL